MSIGLIGYRGSGKSTIGKRLADRLWQQFVDTDQRIVELAGKNIREIFEQDGEPAFRDLETQVVHKVCGEKEIVIAFGGGALDREENRAAIKESGIKLVYLRCEPEELFRRIQADPQTAHARPSLTHLAGSIEEIKTVLARREPIWRSMKAAELDVTHLTPEETVPYIVRLA
jgi:shikimate kinase